MTDYLTTSAGRRIAYDLSPGAGPAVAFLGGFKSDMEGTKALWLRDRMRAQGRAFLRFDYSGHGQSEGRFEDGCIGDWFEDALAVLSLIEGPIVLVGSSMGGWISLLIVREAPERVAGLVTIAAAPDFTEDSMWAGLSEAERLQLAQTGQVALPSEYGEPYIITRRLIEEGRKRLVLRQPLHLRIPARFLQGTADADVSLDLALRLLAHVSGDDVTLTLRKGADHRFSDPDCLSMLGAALGEVIGRING